MLCVKMFNVDGAHGKRWPVTKISSGFARLFTARKLSSIHQDMLRHVCILCKNLFLHLESSIRPETSPCVIPGAQTCRQTLCMSGGCRGDTGLLLQGWPLICSCACAPEPPAMQTEPAQRNPDQNKTMTPKQKDKPYAAMIASGTVAGLS